MLVSSERPFGEIAEKILTSVPSDEFLSDWKSIAKALDTPSITIDELKDYFNYKGSQTPKSGMEFLLMDWRIRNSNEATVSNLISTLHATGLSKYTKALILYSNEKRVEEAVPVTHHGEFLSEMGKYQSLIWLANFN